jgi:hypothetical protein
VRKLVEKSFKNRRKKKERELFIVVLEKSIEFVLVNRK